MRSLKLVPVIRHSLHYASALCHAGVPNTCASDTALPTLGITMDTLSSGSPHYLRKRNSSKWLNAYYAYSTSADNMRCTCTLIHSALSGAQLPQTSLLHLPAHRRCDSPTAVWAMYSRRVSNCTSCANRFTNGLPTQIFSTWRGASAVHPSYCSEATIKRLCQGLGTAPGWHCKATNCYNANNKNHKHKPARGCTCNQHRTRQLQVQGAFSLQQ